MQKKILLKCKNIRLIISDVDGVLTDGGMYYSNEGELCKRFHTRDGMAVELLLNHGIKTILITKEKSKIAILRAKKMNVSKIYYGITKKEAELSGICKKYDVTPKEIMYVGDDVNDLELMRKVGFSATPKDGIGQIKKVADYVCKAKGGEGVLREVADMLLSVKFPDSKY